MIIWATQRPAHRLLRCAAYVALLIPMAATGSNSGIVAVTVGTIWHGRWASIAAAGPRAPWRRWPGSAVVGAVLVSTVSLANIQDRRTRASMRSSAPASGAARRARASARALCRRAWACTGAGNVLGDGPVSTKPRLVQEEAPLVKEAHDDYLAALIERGPLGFIGILIVRVQRAGTRLLRRDEGAAELLTVIRRPNALLGAVVGTLVGGPCTSCCMCVTSGRCTRWWRRRRCGGAMLRRHFGGGCGRLGGSWHAVLVGNMAARIGALGCVFAATLLLAHDGGAAVVGVYALFHVLPGLVGTMRVVRAAGGGTVLPGRPRPRGSGGCGRRLIADRGWREA